MKTHDIDFESLIRAGAGPLTSITTQTPQEDACIPQSFAPLVPHSDETEGVRTRQDRRFGHELRFEKDFSNQKIPMLGRHLWLELQPMIQMIAEGEKGTRWISLQAFAYYVLKPGSNKTDQLDEII